MKKFNYFFMLLCVACVFGSCAVGSYVPSSINLGGTSTQVVLSQANFRVVRNIETVVEINNDNLRRADVEKSAFAELMRKYPLTGSQAYINVVLEEIRREKIGMGGGLQRRKQFVAVRATIIEFLQENGQPIQSVEAHYNTAPQRVAKDEAKTVETVKAAETAKTVEAIKEKKYSNAEIIEMAKAKKNQYYIMYLFKSNNFDKNKLSEAEKYFDMQKLQKEKTKYSFNDLRNLSAEHDEYFDKFARYK